MKLFLQTALSLMVLLAVATGARAQMTTWTDVKPAGFGETIIEIETPAPDGYYAISLTSFLKSTDGGIGWWTYRLNNVLAFDIAFHNRDTGYFVGRTGTASVIGRTSDAGETFDFVYTGSGIVTSIDFLDKQHGLASATNGTILKTTDGGLTWSPYGPQSSDVYFHKVSFATATTAFALGYIPDGQPNKVYKSTDAGLTWTKVYDNGTDYMKPIFYGIDFVSATVGYAAGQDAEASTLTLRSVWKTIDAGVTWTRHFEMPGPAGVVMRSVEMLNDSVGFAVGDRGKLLRTSNGRIWFQEAPPTDSNLYAIGMVSPTLGFVGGTEALLMRQVTYEPSVQISPASLDFGTMLEGTKEMTFTISPANPAGLTVRSLVVVDENSAGFEIVSPAASMLPMRLEPGQSLTVTIRFTPRANLDKLLFAGIDVTTDDPRMPVKQVILKADTRTGGSEYPQLSLSKSTLEFGQVRVTEFKDETFTISTANDKELTLDSLYLIAGSTAPHGLSITTPTLSFPITIPPGSPLTVTVRFAPTEPIGEIDANIVVRTNDPDNPEIMLVIAADAEDAPIGVDEFFIPDVLDLW